MLGVGQRDNVDLFSRSWDCFLTIPRPSPLILPSPSTLSEPSERRGSPPSGVQYVGFYPGEAAKERSELFFVFWFFF